MWIRTTFAFGDREISVSPDTDYLHNLVIEKFGDHLRSTQLYMDFMKQNCTKITYYSHNDGPEVSEWTVGDFIDDSGNFR